MVSISSLKLIAIGGIKSLKGTQQTKTSSSFAQPGSEYKGYSQIAQGTDFKLIGQTAKYYSETLSGVTLAAGATRTITRTPGTDFYLKLAIVSYYTQTQAWDILDTQAGFQFMIYIAYETGGYGSQKVDFPVPVKFPGDIQYQIGTGLIPAHKVVTQFFGWEEQKP